MPPPLITIVPQFRFFLLLLLVVLLPPPCAPYVTSGSLSTLSSWSFLSRFCFLPIDCTVVQCENKDAVENYGMFSYKIHFRSGNDLKLEVYFQKSTAGLPADGWLAVYPPDRNVREPSDSSGSHGGQATSESAKKRAKEILTCSDRQQFTAAHFNMYDHQSLVTRSSSDGLDREVTGYTYFKASTPKYFFVAIANCDPDCACDYKNDVGGDANCTAGVGRTCDGPLILDYEFEFTNGKDKYTKVSSMSI